MKEDNEKVFIAQKEKVLALIQSDTYKPAREDELAYVMGVPAAERGILTEIIDALVIDGAVTVTKKGKIMLPEALSMVKGTFFANARGFGFVRPEEAAFSQNKQLRHLQTVTGQMKDVFIPAPLTKNAMHQDVVLCLVNPGNKPTEVEGEIIQILEREKDLLVGEIIQKGKNKFILQPDDNKYPPISISRKDLKGAAPGHKVAISYNFDKTPHGVVESILGHKNEPGIDILSMVVDRQVPYRFSDAVYEEVQATPIEVSSKDIVGRLDLRDEIIFTIDGEDAKDLDDAVHIKKLPNGNMELGVHIADVSHYVNPGSSVEEAAYSRGNSLYLANGVIPMLPPSLSNGICSLHENVDRLTVSCIMEINDKGVVINHQIVPSVIKSHLKMTYTIVNEIIEEQINQPDNPVYNKKYQLIAGQIADLYELSIRLDAKRNKRGALTFNFPETRVVLDDNDKAIDIIKVLPNKATKVIEEAMILCNETVAEEYHWLEYPFIYRVHEEMSSEKYQSLAESMKLLGIPFPGKKDNPLTMQRLLDSVSGEPMEPLVAQMILRSMKQAYYSPDSLGHFGLASDYYSHFTAPIRRYADLTIHRIIKDRLGEKNNRKWYELHLEDICKQASKTERIAEQLERDVTAMKKVEFMEDKIGEIFEGKISGITNWGVYVELDNTVEGLISISNLHDDYYLYDPNRLTLTGERTGKTLTIGTPLRIQVDRADKMMGQLDFSLISL